MKILYFYTREGCHLCEIMLEELMPLIRNKVKLEIRNVDSQDAWKKKYGTRVPLIKSGEKIISEYRLNHEFLQDYLNARLEKS